MAGGLNPVSLEEAWGIFRNSLRPLGRGWVGVLSSHGRVLGEDIASPWDLPPEDMATMDGYALAAEDVPKGGPLRVVGEARMGSPWGRGLGPGEAVRVVTGSPLPRGANAVLPLERASEGADGAIWSATRISPWVNVTRRGAFLRRGDILLRAGERLGPEALAILVSVGIDKVMVKKRPRVRVVLTGSELVPPGAHRPNGGIFASHGLYIRCLVEALGGRAVVHGPVPDDVIRIQEIVRQRGTEQLLVTTGGTGKGKGDLIFKAMEELGAKVLFKGVRMRPGATVSLFETDGLPVLVLPGGIGGIEVGCEVFLRPGLTCLLGEGGGEMGWAECVVTEDLRRDPDASRFVEARIWAEGGRLYAAPVPRRPRGWGVPSARAHGWIEVPPGEGEIQKGCLVRVRWRALSWATSGDGMAGLPASGG